MDEPKNRFQRWYFAWAEPRYARMAPDLRRDVERIDRWLYSRRAAGFWLGLACALLGSTAGLTAAGFPAPLALIVSTVVWLGLPLAVLGTWLQPTNYTLKEWARKVVLVVAGAYAGALLGFLIGRMVKHGGLDTDTLAEALWTAARQATPLLAVAVAAVIILVWGVSLVRRNLLQAELERMRLVQERDAAARQAAEARLRVLQAQIEPHFIFNTLAALQHWVDTGDARAGSLLRALGEFLRQSVALLGRERVPLADEVALARVYLDIMRARLGDRLIARFEIDPAAASLELPPGLLLTLVENAVEHGISPAVHGGEVVVRAAREGGDICMEVEDDGVGLSLPPPPEGVGLRNSHERLATLFGARARLELLSRATGGTLARVRIADTSA
jgi:glucose-6-phosphate-specific signal transduction histidine kinase